MGQQAIPKVTSSAYNSKSSNSIGSRSKKTRELKSSSIKAKRPTTAPNKRPFSPKTAHKASRDPHIEIGPKISSFASLEKSKKINN